MSAKVEVDTRLDKSRLCGGMGVFMMGVFIMRVFMMGVV